jgi:hypothetical protein
MVSEMSTTTVGFYHTIKRTFLSVWLQPLRQALGEDQVSASE